MDWIDKIEKEKKEEEQAKERNNKEKAEKLRKEEAAFGMAKEKLCPVIKSTIAELNSRVGIKLALHQSATSIEVTKLGEFSKLRNPHQLIFSDPSESGESVLVTAIQAGQCDRPELDDVDKSDWNGVKYDEMYGRDETIVNVRVSLTDLLEGDLQLLMEWLSKTEAYDKLGAPQIKAVRSKNDKIRLIEKEKEEREKAQHRRELMHSILFRAIIWGLVGAVGGCVMTNVSLGGFIGGAIAGYGLAVAIMRSRIN